MSTARYAMRRVLLFALLAWPAIAAGQSPGIDGRVVDDGTSATVQGATVAWRAGTRLVTTLTDARGLFSVPASEQAAQRLAIVKAGFVTHTASFVPGSGAIEIRLRRTAIATGNVRDADGIPVAGATVNLQPLTGEGNSPSATTSTDDRGEFRTELAPGRYRVNTLGRLVSADAAPISQALSDVVTVDMRAGETTSIALTHRDAATAAKTLETGVISGVVHDAAGELAAGITIRVFRGEKRGALRYLRPVGQARCTDDEGRYRLFHLEPGTYVVQAVDERPFIDALGVDGDVPVYYPAAAAATAALHVRIAAGQERAGIDIRLVRESYVKVSGAVVANGIPAVRQVALTRRLAAGGFLEPRLVSQVTATGAFEFPKVVPGDYIVHTTEQLTETSPFAVSAVSDVEGLVVRTMHPRTLTGRVVVDGQTGKRPAFRLAFQPVDAESSPDSMFPGLGLVLAGSDGTFSLTAPVGTGRFVMRSGGDGWFVESVRTSSAHAGYEPLDPETDTDITIVLARATGTIEGTVRGGGTPARRLHVVAFSGDERLWYERSPSVVSVPVDDWGQFALPPLPADAYHVVAFDAANVDVASGEQLEPEVLRALAVDAVRVTVLDNARQRVTAGVSSAGN